MEMDMTDKCRVTGLFLDEKQAASALRALHQTAWAVQDVRGPIPSASIFRAAGHKKSPVGWFTLFGGILGFLVGLGLAVYASRQWELIVSGKPVVALVPFFIVAFELTILFSVAANFLGFLVFTGLPRLKLPDDFDPSCSGDRFGITAECASRDRSALIDFFKEMGAHVP